MAGGDYHRATGRDVAGLEHPEPIIAAEQRDPEPSEPARRRAPSVSWIAGPGCRWQWSSALSRFRDPPQQRLSRSPLSGRRKVPSITMASPPSAQRTRTSRRSQHDPVGQARQRAGTAPPVTSRRVLRSPAPRCHLWVGDQKQRRRRGQYHRSDVPALGDRVPVPASGGVVRGVPLQCNHLFAYRRHRRH